jgi:hypothetical protein
MIEKAIGLGYARAASGHAAAAPPSIVHCWTGTPRPACESTRCVKKHPEYSEHAYFLAVETAFKKWEAMQNIGR